MLSLTQSGYPIARYDPAAPVASELTRLAATLTKVAKKVACFVEGSGHECGRSRHLVQHQGRKVHAHTIVGTVPQREQFIDKLNSRT